MPLRDIANLFNRYLPFCSKTLCQTLFALLHGTLSAKRSPIMAANHIPDVVCSHDLCIHRSLSRHTHWNAQDATHYPTSLGAPFSKPSKMANSGSASHPAVILLPAQPSLSTSTFNVNTVQQLLSPAFLHLAVVAVLYPIHLPAYVLQSYPFSVPQHGTDHCPVSHHTIYNRYHLRTNYAGTSATNTLTHFSGLPTVDDITNGISIPRYTSLDDHNKTISPRLSAHRIYQ